MRRQKRVCPGRSVRTASLIVRPNGEQLAKIGSLLEEGRLLPPQIEEMEWSSVKEAHTLSQNAHTCGKIVLNVSSAG